MRAGGGGDPLARQLDPDDHLQRDRERGDRAGRAPHGDRQPPARATTRRARGSCSRSCWAIVFGVPPYLRRAAHLRGARGARATSLDLGHRVPRDHEPRHGHDVPAAAGDGGAPRRGQQHAAHDPARRAPTCSTWCSCIWWVFGGLGVAAAWGSSAPRGRRSSRAGSPCLPAFWFLCRGFAGLRIRRFAFRWRTQWQILRIGVPGCGQLARAHGPVPLPAEVRGGGRARGGRGRRRPRRPTASACASTPSPCSAASAGPRRRPRSSGQNLGRGRSATARSRPRGSRVGLNAATMLLFAGGLRALRRAADPLPGLRQQRSPTSRPWSRIGRTYLQVSTRGLRRTSPSGSCSPRPWRGPGHDAPLALHRASWATCSSASPSPGSSPSTRPTLGGLRALWLAVLGPHLAVAVAYVVWFRLGPWAAPRSLA